jgi:hypothetical protein
MGIFTKYDPMVITYLNQDGTGQIQFFAVADDGQLYRSEGLNGDWRRIGLMPSGARGVGTPAGVSYIDQSGRATRVFVTGEDGGLNVAWFDGSNWVIEPLGVPPGGMIRSNVAAISYFFDQRVELIYAFVVAEDSQLYVNEWNGISWQWSGISSRSPVSFAGAINLSALVFFDGPEPQIYVFVNGNGTLYLTGAAVNWTWTTIGEGGGAVVEAYGDVTGYVDLNDKLPRGFAWFMNPGEINSNLYVKWADSDNTSWTNPQNWNYSDQGSPMVPASLAIKSLPGAVHYVHKTISRLRVYFTDVIFVFILLDNNTLGVNYWDGKNWNWAEQGNPGDILVEGKPCVAAYYENFTTERLFAAIRGQDGNLYVN